MGWRVGTESFGEGHHGTSCSMVSLGGWGMGWTGWMRSFGEEICVDSINQAKKQADLKSTIQWNKLLREATLWYEWWNRFTRSCLKEFRTVWAPPYTGSLGQIPHVTPPCWQHWGHLEQRVVFRETIWYPLMSHSSLRDWGMGWKCTTVASLLHTCLSLQIAWPLIVYLQGKRRCPKFPIDSLRQRWTCAEDSF